MAITDSFVERARGTARRIVLPEGTDARMVAAAARLVEEDIAAPILLGAEAGVRAAAEEAGADFGRLTFVDPAADPRLEEYIQTYARHLGVRVLTCCHLCLKMGFLLPMRWLASA